MNTAILLAEIDYITIIPFAVFGLFAVGTWIALDIFSAKNQNTEQRLDEFSNPELRSRGKSGSKSDAFAKVLEKASPALAKPLQPKSDEEVGKLKLKLQNAGFRTEAAPTIFLGMKFVGLLVGLMLAGGGVALTRGFDQKGIGILVGTAGFLFYLPDILVGFIGHGRKQKIFLGLPDALDLMVVCVEAGLGLDQAMRKVSDEMAKIYPIIAEEFALANFQLQMGRTRSSVLRELGLRTGVDDMKSLANIIIQAEKFGSSVAQALRVQSDSMRTRRRQIAEEKAAKTAVKLIFPLVIFIFPGIFVVLVGPAAITMVREMFPKMSGNG